MKIGERVKAAREAKGYTQEALAHLLGYKSRSSVNKIEQGRDIPRDIIVKLANLLDVTPSYLMGWDDAEEKPHPNAQLMPQEKIRMIPVFESVSAGLGIGAENRVVEFIPLFIQSDTEAERTICVRVCGDSMHPKIEDGDLVQVLKQETAETGDIVVILDGDNGYVKRFILGKTVWCSIPFTCSTNKPAYLRDFAQMRGFCLYPNGLFCRFLSWKCNIFHQNATRNAT